MQKILVSYEVSVSQSKDTFVVSKPDYIFSGEFDKDDVDSSLELSHLESKVLTLVKSFEDLGCQVIAYKKELTNLFSVF